MAEVPLIVVSNDDPIYLSLMQYILVDAGYDSALVVPNNDVYATARLQQPALILIDIAFGVEHEGWLNLDRLILDPSTTHIPLIVCSTDTRSLREKAAWFAAHHIGVLEKPFNVPELLAAIARTLAPSRNA